ncbi:MAG: AAA family ATPase, partial [Solirubrobacterales bacterium]
MAVGERLGRYDAVDLVGRERELSAAEAALAADAGGAILFVHGPGGIGKSSLARALARRAMQAGRSVWEVDARDVPPSPEGLSDALAGVIDEDRPLIVIDSFELIEPSGAHLRGELIPRLPEGSVVLIASRNPPDRGWLEGHWSELMEEIRLGPLADEEAVELVGSQGVEGVRATDVVAWSQGHPLALELGARVATEDPAWVPGEGIAPDELVRALVRRLGEADVAAGHLPALGVAAIARSTTPALLEAALPEHDADAEWKWLSARSFAEPLGEGIALHALLREAVRADLKRRDPVLEACLKRRIADHVYKVAESSGELNKVLDLSHLIENMGLRWFVWEASARFYLTGPGPGDADEIDRALAEPGVDPIGGGKDVWEIARPFFKRMPELGVVARDPNGRIAGFTFVPTTAVDDPELEAAPLIGPCLRHGRDLEPRGEAVIMPFMCDLTGDLSSGIIGMLANAALLRSSHTNPRYTYMTIDREIEFGR